MKEKKRFKVINKREETVEERKKRRGVRTAIITVIILLIIAVFITLLCLRYRSFNDYEVLDTVKTDSVSEASFFEYNGNILKVSKNGSICQDKDGNKLFSVGYEMNDPCVDLRGNYIVIAAKKGQEVYIMDDTGLKGRIELTRTIIDVSIAEQGTIAVLTKDSDTYYVNLYNYAGDELVQGAMHIENSGYPLAIALSEDAKKMAISIVSVEKGKIKTSVNFYNFGVVGQNKIDNLVSDYSYYDMVIPRLKFFGKDRLVAVGDNCLKFFKGSEEMKETKTIKLRSEIRTIFFSDSKLSIICDACEGDIHKEKATSDAVVYGKEVLSIYNEKGDELMREIVEMNYTNAYFSGDEVVLTRDDDCLIYAVGGTLRYKGSFGDNIIFVTKGSVGNEFYIMFRDKIERVKLK